MGVRELKAVGDLHDDTRNASQEGLTCNLGMTTVGDLHDATHNENGTDVGDNVHDENGFEGGITALDLFKVEIGVGNKVAGDLQAVGELHGDTHDESSIHVGLQVPMSRRKQPRHEPVTCN